jgi:hypothetical protein
LITNKKHIIFFYNVLLIFAIFIIPCLPAYSQLSPGKLSKAHSQLEGLNNCTKCHELGEKISEKKCLDCHKELNIRISQDKGYHKSKNIKGRSCISCHSDHHGLNFEMIRFDKKNFNHNLTGYELKDKHSIEDCAKCHKDANVSDPNIKKLDKTFLGLDTKCLTCHDDYHQKTLSNDCAKCHNYKGFKPAPLFNHDKSDFPLNGAHEKQKCESCHKKEVRAGKEFQVFSGIPFKSCSACHEDPHHGEFGTNCSSCHNEVSFHQIKANSNFNHNLTGFELEGKHKIIDCKKCHDSRPGTKGNYKEFEAIPSINCLTCHIDEHEKKFSSKCEDCHNQQTFKINSKLKDFNHTLTGYSLEGKHNTVDCKKCHTGAKMTNPLPHEKCAVCHTDYHKGEFANTKYNDCNACHSTAGFTESSFDFDNHEKSAFPLSGSHIATPCISCHKKSAEWKFRNMGIKCVDCHDNIHSGFISNEFMPANDCKKCHSDDSWNIISFDHNKTKFKLEGKHNRTECRKCHFTYENNKIKSQKFLGLENKCISCHENKHEDQFTVNGETDCKRCHGFENWDRSNFNHDNAAFKLDGAHNKLSCEKCHFREQRKGKEIVIYKNGNLLCSDCHK